MEQRKGVSITFLCTRHEKSSAARHPVLTTWVFADDHHAPERFRCTPATPHAPGEQRAFRRMGATWKAQLERYPMMSPRVSRSLWCASNQYLLLNLDYLDPLKCTSPF